jgi:hypothetical protein
MSGICWRLVHALSRLLEPDERDAALGDFLESGLSAGRALRDLLGLIARRQSALWADWRPWLALLGIVGPVTSMLLSFAFGLSLTLELNFWILGNYTHFDPALLEQTGLTVGHGIFVMLRHAFLLFAWSWTAGFVLGSLSRRAIWANGVLLSCLAALFFTGALRGATPPKPSMVLAVSALLILLPLIWGVRQGLRLGALRLRPAILCAAAVAATTALSIWTDGWWRGGAWNTRQLILTLILCWPVGYMVASATRLRDVRGKTAERT